MVPTPLFSPRRKVSISSLNLESLAKTHEMWGSVLLRQNIPSFYRPEAKGWVGQVHDEVLRRRALDSFAPCDWPTEEVGRCQLFTGEE